MKNLLYTAALGLLIVGCSKPTIEDEGIFIPEVDATVQGEDATTSSNTNTTTTDGTATATTTAEAATTTTEADPYTTVGSVDDVPTGTASVVLTGIHDDGKGNITETYAIVHAENQRVAYVHFINEDGTRSHTRYSWEQFTTIDVLPHQTIEVSIMNVNSFTHRGIQIYQNVSLNIDLNELDRAIDLAGEFWIAERITVVDYLDGNAGLASGREFFIGVNYQTNGFNTHVLLHENGHNLDFNNNNFGRVLNEEIYEMLPASFRLSEWEYIEFKAEVFAWYYLMRDEIPTFVVEILDYFLG